MFPPFRFMLPGFAEGQCSQQIRVFQTILNLSVVIGLIPVTGVTLPFLSYGGSSLLISMISIGIILNVARQNN